MIIKTYQMKQTMNNNPVKLVGKLSSVKFGIVFDRVDADEQITGQYISITLVERNYIGKIVMLKKLHIDIEDVIVGAEYDIYVAETADFALCNKLKPLIIK